MTKANLLLSGERIGTLCGSDWEVYKVDNFMYLMRGDDVLGGYNINDYSFNIDPSSSTAIF